MHILVVTGRIAGPSIRRLTAKRPRGVRVDVAVLDVPVAAMMTAEYVAEKLVEKGIRGYDLILVPGLLRGDASIISERLGITVWKGPRSMGDLPIILEAVAEGQKLSPKEPADEVLRERRLDRLRTMITSAEERCRGPEADGLCIPIHPPPIRIAVELPPSLPEESLAAEARRFAGLGADLVVVGIGPQHSDTDVKRRVRLVSQTLEIPVAVDAGRPEHLAAGIEAGACMAMSIYKGYAEQLETYGSKAVFVAVPSRGEGVPRSPSARIRLLKEILDEAGRHGLEKIVVDPVLLPPMQGLAESLDAYSRASRRFRDKPLMMGIANVTELIDADSIGVNALLTSIAAELRVSLLLVAEESWKARGSLAETMIASFMAAASLLLGSPPKDLGVDLLVVKEKRPKHPEHRPEPRRLVELKKAVRSRRMDPIGYVKIRVIEGRVEACLYRYEDEMPELCVVGRDGLSVARVLVRETGISDPDHLSYIAYEASKAEVAAVLGKSYVQEEPLFIPVEERLKIIRRPSGASMQAGGSERGAPL